MQDLKNESEWFSLRTATTFLFTISLCAAFFLLIFVRTFVGQYLRESIAVWRSFESMFHHGIANDLTCPLVIANHDAFVHDDTCSERELLM